MKRRFKVVVFALALSGASFGRPADAAGFSLCKWAAKKTGHFFSRPALNPEITFRTDEYLIRPLQDDQIELRDYAALLWQRDALQFYGDGSHSPGVGAFQHDVEVHYSGKQYRFVVIDRSDKIVGYLSYHRWHRWNGTVDVGFALDPKLKNSRVLVDSIRATIPHLKALGIKTIYAYFARDNHLATTSAGLLGFIDPMEVTMPPGLFTPPRQIRVKLDIRQVNITQ